MKNTGINERSLEVLTNIFSKHSLVNEVFLYGSRAKAAEYLSTKTS